MEAISLDLCPPAHCAAAAVAAGVAVIFVVLGPVSFLPDPCEAVSAAIMIRSMTTAVFV